MSIKGARIYGKVVKSMRANKETAEEKDKRIKEKHLKLKREKHLGNLKSNCKCAHIKSAGNGL